MFLRHLRELMTVANDEKQAWDNEGKSLQLPGHSAAMRGKTTH